MGQGPRPGPPSSSSRKERPASRAVVLRLLVHKSRSPPRTPRPRVACLFSRSVLGAAAVAASAARSKGHRHEARRVALVLCGLVAARRALVALRLRPAIAALAAWSALRLGPQSLAVGFARFTPAPPVVRAPASSIRRPRPRVASWSVVSVVVPALRAPAAPLLGPPGLSAAWCVVALGVPFLKRSLRARPAPAAGSFVGGRCHGPCFSALATPRLGFAAPGSFDESRARARSLALGHKARSNQVGGWE